MYMEPEELEHILDGRKKPAQLQFSLLSNITKNFSEEREIGKGGFATVYKGVLPNGNVAVKRIMNRHTIDDALFYREVDSLLAVNHQNIVKFLGYCSTTDHTALSQEGLKAHIYAEQRERLLCFEYIDNGSLQEHITDHTALSQEGLKAHIYAEQRERLLCFEYIDNGSLQEHITDELRGLEWNARYEIIKGICNGLNYLHKEKRIYHMDLKPANVLLNSNMVPKITDFGQSRYDEKSQTIAINRYGSRGYCPPEYTLYGKMSPKSDIYSLGMIIIELVTGDKEIPNNNKSNVLRRWRHRWRKTGKESPLGYQQVTKCIDIGLLCQEIDPSNRPFIWEIVRDINGMEDTNSQISNDNESKVGQIHPYLDDDMLGIEPLELHFPFERNNEMSCALELTNETDSYIAFEVQKMSPLPYCTKPHEGIVPPRSKCSVDITLQPQDKAPHRANEFIVRSTRVNSGFTTEHITDFFDKSTGNDVDEVNVDVVFDLEVIPGSNMLLDVHPLELRFHFEPNKLMACSLDLTNKTDEQVAFGLMTKSGEDLCFQSSLPLFGIVDPGTIFTFVVIMDRLENLTECLELILLTNTYCGIPINQEIWWSHVQNGEELGNTVRKMTLKSVCALQGETIFEPSIRPSIKIISVEDTIDLTNQTDDENFVRSYDIYSMDANKTEPLIITGSSRGHALLWNYDTKELIGHIRIPKEVEATCVKFIERKGWFLVGSDDGFIHVYNYNKEMQKITSIKTKSSSLWSLAIHPTQSYVLSACITGIKLWDWDYRWFGWKCMQKFSDNRNGSRAVVFNPEDYNSFASGHNDGIIMVWNLDYAYPNYTLYGHSGCVLCLDFFTQEGQQYLITGSYDKTAKIWDLQKKECVGTLPHKSEVAYVLPHPKLPLLVTGTSTGDVYFWSSTSFRLKRILNIDNVKHIQGLSCLIESGRVVIAHMFGLSVIEVSDDEEQGDSSNDESSISAAD